MKKALLLTALMVCVVPAFAWENAADANKPTATSNMKHEVSDSDITAKVKAEYLKQKVFGPGDVSVWTVKVDTKDGVVMLSGTTDNKIRVDNAIKIAKAIKGVKNVKSTVVVEPKK